jgi:hypothetical protein
VLYRVLGGGWISGRHFWDLGAEDEGDVTLGSQTLPCAERDDAPDRVVRRDANSHAITRDNLNTKAAHAAAELGEDFVAGVAFHTIKSPRVHRLDGALHVN